MGESEKKSSNPETMKSMSEKLKLAEKRKREKRELEKQLYLFNIIY